MATPKPGEIRCPTCHRSTPPAAFCTQCGSAIPSDARIRPRGMDRDELQDRIRARRSGGDPYRRGTPADEGRYERYEPEPADERASRAVGPGGDRRRDYLDEGATPGATAPVPAQRRDLVRDQDDWAPPPPPVPVAAPPPPEPDVDAPTRADNFDDARYADQGPAYGYEYDDWEDERERRSGGAWAIAGFLALGVLALLGGALLANVFGDDPGVAQNPTSSPSPPASAVATPSSTAEPTGGAASPSPTADGTDAAGSPAPPGEPVAFPDGFVVEAQPCLPGSADVDGCDSNAATNSGSLWAWVGFENGTQNDVIGAELIGPDGTSLTSGSIDLAGLGCRPNCLSGWTYFPYSNLAAGEYEVLITRNGEPAGTMTFEVS